MADPLGALRVHAACSQLQLFLAHLTHAQGVQIMNNQITLVGHAGKDPESKTFEDSNNTVVKFSLAVKEYL